MFVTTDRTEKQFHILSGARDWIEKELTDSGCLSRIQMQLTKRSSSGRPKSTPSKKAKAKTGQASGAGGTGSSGSEDGKEKFTPVLRPLRVPGLIHFVYRNLVRIRMQCRLC